MTRRRPRRSRGFTLIEVMIAGTIFLVGFTAFVAGIRYASNAYAHQRNLTTALTVGEGVLEELLLAQQTDSWIAAGSNSRTFDDDGIESPGGKFTVNWEVTAGAPIDGLRTINMDITWTNPLGNTKSLNIETVRQ